MAQSKEQLKAVKEVNKLIGLLYGRWRDRQEVKVLHIQCSAHVSMIEHLWPKTPDLEYFKKIITQTKENL